MPKFDWNGNGKSDAFDHFMDMKVSGSSNSDGEESETRTNPSSYKRTSNTNENKDIKGISIGGKPLYDATKDSNGVTILKCMLVTALCIGGIVLPVSADMGPFETLLCIFCGVGLSILLLKNN